jgi:uncharacterized protein (TIGR03083 family)
VATTDATPWVRALRASHDRLAGLVAKLDAGGLRARSYDSEWSVADVLSHLGSGAEITSLYLDPGLTGGDPPAQAVFQQIWDTWNARSPEDQATLAVAADEALVARLEALSPEQRAAFRVAMFGPAPLDLAGFLGMRLNEHALHTWDIAVSLDPAARVAPDAVVLMLPALSQLVGFVGKKAPEPATVAVTITDPDGVFTLDTGGVSLVAGAPGTATATLVLPAEEFVRLLTGRLDAADEAKASGVTLSALKSVFPGF